VELEEAKGTLLAYDNITVEGPRGGTPTVARLDSAARPAFLEGPSTVSDPVGPEAIPGASADPAKADRPGTGFAGQTFSFRFTVGLGPKPVEIRGSFTVGPVQPVAAPKAR
jgi:hypothetical protein